MVRSSAGQSGRLPKRQTAGSSPAGPNVAFPTLEFPDNQREHLPAVEQISKKLMNWASILEPETRAQAERTAAMPFIYPHLALMPETRLGRRAAEADRRLRSRLVVSRRIVTAVRRPPPSRMRAFAS
jgi:hypothetical protein